MLPKVTIAHGPMRCGEQGFVASRKVMGRDINVAEFIYESDAFIYTAFFNLLAGMSEEHRDKALEFIRHMNKP